MFNRYRHGVAMRIFPSGHIRDTRNSVVAISPSASSFNFSLTKIKKKKNIILFTIRNISYSVHDVLSVRVSSGGVIPFSFIRDKS